MADPIDIIDADDLVAYLRSGTADQVAVFVDLANALVTEAWVDPVDPIPVSVQSITLEVAARPARNPKGLASWSRSIDDGSRTERLPDRAARAGVYLLDHERRELRGKPRSRRRLQPIRTRPGW